MTEFNSEYWELLTLWKNVVSNNIDYIYGNPERWKEMRHACIYILALIYMDIYRDLGWYHDVRISEIL